MQAERHGKQPPHGRVEAVKGPQSRQREPGPPFFSHRSLAFGAGMGLISSWISASARPNLPPSRIAIGVRRAVAAFEAHLVWAVRLRPLHEKPLVERDASLGLASSFTIQPSIPSG